MAYKSKYVQKVKRDPTGKKRVYSHLEAKFRFRNEVAPRDRRDIRKRISDFVKTVNKNYDRLKPYSSENNEIPSVNYFIAKELGLKFSFSIWDWRDVKRSDMVDLDAMDYYILTGEEPEKKE